MSVISTFRSNKWFLAHVECISCHRYSLATLSQCLCGEPLPTGIKCSVPGCEAAPIARYIAVKRKWCPCQDKCDKPQRYCGIKFAHPCGMAVTGPGGRTVQLYSYLVPSNKFPIRPHLLEIMPRRETVRIFRLETGFYEGKNGETKVSNGYGVFPSIDETKCIKWAASFPPSVQQCFQEVVIGPQRLWLDIDWNCKERGRYFSDIEWGSNLAQVIDTAVSVIAELSGDDPRNVRDLCADYESHGEHKRSNHLIFLYWVDNSALVKGFQFSVKGRLPAELQLLVDPCANDNRPLRIPGSWKICGPGTEKRILRLMAGSPVQQDLLVGLPTGGDPFLKICTVPENAQSPVIESVRRPAQSGLSNISRVVSADAEKAFQLAKLVIDPYQVRNVELRGETRSGCFSIGVSGPNPVGFPCVHCGRTDEHAPHGNPDLFLTCNEHNGWWTLRSYRGSSAAPKKVGKKNAKQKNAGDTKRFSPPVHLGPLATLPDDSVPNGVETVTLQKHEKLFACWSDKRPAGSGVGKSKEDAGVRMEWVNWNVEQVKSFFVRHGLDAFNRVLDVIDQPIHAYLSAFSYQDAVKLQVARLDPSHLFVVVCLLRGDCAVDWQNYINIVIRSLCNTGKTTQLKLILEAFIAQFLHENGRLPRILFATVRVAQARNFTPEFAAWFEAFTVQLGIPVVDGVTNYEGLKGRTKDYRSTDFLVLQLESACHLVEALNDICNWREHPFDVVVLDEITSVLKQLSSKTMVRLNHALFLLQQPTRLRILLDNDIDRRCWDFLSGINAGPTIFYNNTFRVCDAAISRRAHRVPDRTILHEMMLGDLRKGECVAFHEGVRGKLHSFATRAQKCMEDGKMPFSMLVYSSDKNYVIVPHQYEDQLTEQERSLLQIFPASTKNLYGYRYADTVQALDVDVTLKDIMRWWNYDWIHFIGYTFTITVGLDFNRQRIPIFYAIFASNGPNVRDGHQAHFRCRQVHSLYFVIDARRPQYMDTSQLSEGCLELAQLSSAEAACGTRELVLWALCDGEDWATPPSGDHNRIEWGATKQTLGPFEVLPSWFKPIHLANQIEDIRSRELTEIEVLMTLKQAGYIFAPCPKERIDALPLVCFPTQSLGAVKYDDVEELDQQRLKYLLDKRGHFEKLSAADNIALTRHFFDSKWLYGQPGGIRADVWWGYLSMGGDKSASDLTAYTARDARDGPPSPATRFYQLLSEVHYQQKSQHCARGLQAPGARKNPLHASLLQPRLDAVLKICSWLGLAHSQDTAKEFRVGDLEQRMQKIESLCIDNLWNRRKRQDGKTEVLPLLNHVFSRWSGMTFQKVISSGSVTKSKRATMEAYALKPTHSPNAPILIPILLESVASVGDNSEPLFSGDS